MSIPRSQRSRVRRGRAALLAALGLAASLASPLRAQTYQVLHSFAAPQPTAPGRLISDASGNFYGTTSGGGAAQVGAIFKLDASNDYALTILHTFSGADGAWPGGLIADASGNLYGTTIAGGAANQGTAFKLDASNYYALTTLHSFSGADGRSPGALIADASGNLYGATGGGGAADKGTVFKLDAPNGYALTSLHEFNGTDGIGPSGLIADASGNLFGTTDSGGSGAYGTVFRLDASNGYALTTLHNFDDFNQGAEPAGLIADAAGNLYGIARRGGADWFGTVYKLDASNGYAFTNLHDFASLYYPSGALVMDASGSLYGVASQDAYDNGGVFRLDASSGDAFTILHLFNGDDGRLPYAAPILDASGNLYGTTSSGGPGGGTAFKLDASNDYELTTLHGFVAYSEGANPWSALIHDATGNLFGTTAQGGFANVWGTAFKLDASNSYALTTLHSFDLADGSEPAAPLIADASGNLYGTTVFGGEYDYLGYGTVFKLDASNGYGLTSVYIFNGGADGSQPIGALIADASGNLYGTTVYGGDSGYPGHGTVFKLDASNGYAPAILHSFSGGDDGGLPRTALIADASGNLYGSTDEGGDAGHGTVFRLDASNGYALTSLHDFDAADGIHPSGLIADASGNLYGTTSEGGASDDGTVFRLDASNGYALTTLHTFAGVDGANPLAALIADASGNLYGTTSNGGASGYGTIFELDASNGYALTTLHDFHLSGGAHPHAALILDASGNFYGTTASGGAGGTGVAFSFSTTTEPVTVTGITPGSGPSSGGTPVTVSGSGFSETATATVGGAEVSGMIMVDFHTLTGSTPAMNPGTLNDVAVMNSPSRPASPAAILPGGFFADFLDVPQPDIFHADVEKLFRNGITAGCAGGNYCRNNAVTRAQMAVFLLKAEHGSSYAPPACTGVFGDVTCPSLFADWIEQLFHEGITGGCGGGNYCPGSAVTRAQMAVFLLKSEHGSAYAPPACTGLFGDVACPSLFADWIEQLYMENITGGCSANPPLYCPGSPNTRGQMAVFLGKTFHLP